MEVQLRAYSTKRRWLNSFNFRPLYFPEKNVHNTDRLGCWVGPKTVRMPWLERIPARLFVSIVTSNFFNIIPQFTSLGIYWEMLDSGVDLSGSQQAPVSIYRLLDYIPVHSTYALSYFAVKPGAASPSLRQCNRQWASTHLGLSTAQGGILCIIMSLGAFEKLWRATIGFVTSVRPQGTIPLPLDGLSWIYKSLQLQQFTVPLLSVSLIISSYMFRLNCHHQGANTYIARTYSNKIVLQCLCVSNVLIIVKNYSVLNVDYKQ